MSQVAANHPLKDLDQWDDFLEGRYKEGKSEEEFRQYDATAHPGSRRVLPPKSREDDR